MYSRQLFTAVDILSRAFTHRKGIVSSGVQSFPLHALPITHHSLPSTFSSSCGNCLYYRSLIISRLEQRTLTSSVSSSGAYRKKKRREQHKLQTNRHSLFLAQIRKQVPEGGRKDYCFSYFDTLLTAVVVFVLLLLPPALLPLMVLSSLSFRCCCCCLKRKSRNFPLLLDLPRRRVENPEAIDSVRTCSLLLFIQSDRICL